MTMKTKLERAISRLIGGFILSSDALAVQADNLTYLDVVKLRRLETLLKSAAKATSGDIVEFGVALGGSAILLAKEAKRSNRAFHGFDVFNMIPEPTSDKDGNIAKDRYTVIAAKQSRGIGGEEYYGYRTDLFGDVCRAFSKHDIPVDNTSVHLHQGLFEDTLAEFPMTPIAFAHVDCDWYDPVKYCLEQIHARSDVGTTILIDDYHYYEGCKTATTEFLSAHPEYQFNPGRNVALIRTR